MYIIIRHYPEVDIIFMDMVIFKQIPILIGDVFWKFTHSVTVCSRMAMYILYIYNYIYISFASELCIWLLL